MTSPVQWRRGQGWGWREPGEEERVERGWEGLRGRCLKKRMGRDWREQKLDWLPSRCAQERERGRGG